MNTPAMTELEARAEPNETTLAAMDAAELGDDVYGPFDSVEDLMEALDADSHRYSPITNRHITVDTKIKSRHTANAIMKQSGIPFKF